MAKRRPKEDEPALADLTKEIIADAETLIEQQFALLRSELKVSVERYASAALEMSAGAGLLTAGGAFSALAVVHALHRATRLPLWACFGLVGGLLGTAGAGFLSAGWHKASAVRVLPPPLTTAALEENLEWLKDQMH